MQPRTFSAAAVRDALGVARVLYAVELAAGDADRAAAVARAGTLLSDAVRLAELAPGSMGQRAAPMNAEKGLGALRAVGWSPEVEDLIDAALDRVGTVIR